jgi:hypothetical protein
MWALVRVMGAVLLGGSGLGTYVSVFKRENQGKLWGAGLR